MAKLRLDQLVLSRGLATSRAQAQALIMAGKVMRGTERLTKPGMTLDEAAEIFLEGKEHPWVSRGGMKLAHGLEAFDVHPAGLVCLDVGASTGGFTDVLLASGAAKVYAVDVGHGQLDVKLRSDPRVVVMEKTNARHLTREQIPEPIDLIVCDASFISLKTVLPACLALASPEVSGFGFQVPGNEKSKEQEARTAFTRAVVRSAERAEKSPRESQISEASPIAERRSAEQEQTKKQLIALIKPQFEAGKKHAPKGVVRDEGVRRAVCEDIARWIGETMGWEVRGLEESPVRGPKGNIEFLLYATKRA